MSLRQALQLIQRDMAWYPRPVEGAAQACNISKRGAKKRSTIGLVLAAAAAIGAAAVVFMHAPLASRIGTGAVAWIAGIYLFQVKEKT